MRSMSFAKMEMKKQIRRMICTGTLATGWLAAGASVAEGPNVWDGPYVGPQLGGDTNSRCSRWIVPGAGSDVAGQTIGQACGSDSLVGGVQVGESVQYAHFFWGLAADIDFATGKKTSRSWVSNGPFPPRGTYSTSERLSPDEFLIIAPRVGYAGREWAPYLRAGGLVAFGGRDGSIAYTPSGETRPTASFNGGKSFDTIGWVAGGGIECGLYGPWSAGLEYMHTRLGKGSSAMASCAGTAAACVGFSGIALENLHNGFTANMFRVALNYYFDYW